MANVYRLTRRDQPFWDGGRIDPISQQAFAEDDEIVVCAHCNSVFHRSTWDSLSPRCGACRATDRDTRLLYSIEEITGPSHLKIEHAPILPASVLPSVAPMAQDTTQRAVTARFRGRIRAFHAVVWVTAAVMILFACLQLNDSVGGGGAQAYFSARAQWGATIVQQRIQEIGHQQFAQAAHQADRSVLQLGQRSARFVEAINTVGSRLHESVARAAEAINALSIHLGRSLERAERTLAWQWETGARLLGEFLDRF